MSRNDQAVRFAVVQDGIPLSSIWRMWRDGPADIYVGVRVICHSFKTSLHGSGKFRHAFSSDAVSAQFQDESLDRAVHKWTRPTAQLAGATLLFQIIIPDVGLRPASHGQQLSTDTVTLPPPRPGRSWVVAVVESAPRVHMRNSGERPATVLAGWPTENGGNIWVIANEAATSPEIETALAQLRSSLANPPATIQIQETPGGPTSDLRGFLILQHPDNVGRLVDMSVEFLRDAASRDERVRVRAYYLWQNRTGRNCSDPVSNWLEAEQIER